MMEVRGGWSAGGEKEVWRRVRLCGGEGVGAGVSYGGGLRGARVLMLARTLAQTLAPAHGPGAVL
jgi:hypothetical protein